MQPCRAGADLELHAIVKGKRLFEYDAAFPLGVAVAQERRDAGLDLQPIGDDGNVQRRGWTETRAAGKAPFAGHSEFEEHRFLVLLLGRRRLCRKEQDRKSTRLNSSHPSTS